MPIVGHCNRVGLYCVDPYIRASRRHLLAECFVNMFMERAFYFPNSVGSCLIIVVIFLVSFQLSLNEVLQFI